MKNELENDLGYLAGFQTVMQQAFEKENFSISASKRATQELIERNGMSNFFLGCQKAHTLLEQKIPFMFRS